MEHLNGHHLNPDDQPLHIDPLPDPEGGEDELVMDMTDPDVAYLVGMTVVTFQEMGVETEVPEMQEQLQRIFKAYDEADDEFALAGDAIPVFVYMVYHIAQMIDDGELEAEGTEEFLDASEEFFTQMESAFPDIMEELLGDSDEDEDEDEEAEEDRGRS
jgi:hypothetical protein